VFLLCLLTLLGVLSPAHAQTTYTFGFAFGPATGNPGHFGSLGSLGLNTAGNIYVLDFDTRRVQKFDLNGHFVANLGSPGSDGFPAKEHKALRSGQSIERQGGLS
jgi:hypothetical protein